MEGTGGEGEAAPHTVSPSVQVVGPVSAAPQEEPGENSAFSTPASTPCRMKLRSQDSTRLDQVRNTGSLYIYIPLN